MSKDLSQRSQTRMHRAAKADFNLRTGSKFS